MTGTMVAEADRVPRSGFCLNCGTPLAGRYCHACGQSAHVHRSLLSMAHDLLHGAFHFEGRIWRTVPMLVLQPGALTRRYIAGERARFVSPLALFLFTVFLLFATFEALGPGDLGQSMASGWNGVDARTATARTQATQALLAAERTRTALAAAGRSTAMADRQVTVLRARSAALDAAAAAARPGQFHAHSRWPWLNAGLERAQVNPALTIDHIEAAAYKYSWLLIVLSTPLVALLFAWRRRYGLYDHATFVTYSISFMTLLFVVLQLLQAVNAPPWLVVTTVLLVPPAHLFVQLRGAYALGVVGAAWRTVVLLLGAAMALALFAVGVIALEVA